MSTEVLAKALQLRLAYLQKWSWEPSWDLSFFGKLPPDSFKAIGNAIMGVQTKAPPQPPQGASGTANPASVAAAAIAAVSAHPPVTGLLLGGNTMDARGAAALEGLVKRAPFSAQLTSLELCFDRFGLWVPMMANRIGDEGAKAVAGVLAAQTAVQRLGLARNCIGPAGARAIAAALRANTSLTSLDLAGNAIGDGGAGAIAEALAENRTLVRLSVAANGITDAGMASLCAALGRNSTLHTLDVSRNALGAAGAQPLALALSAHCHLRELVASCTGLGNAGCTVVFSALRSNKRLEAVCMWGCGLDDGAVPAIAECIRKGQPPLREIDLTNNGITNTGANDLLQVLSANATVTALRLAKNQVSDTKILDALRSLTERNTVVLDERRKSLALESEARKAARASVRSSRQSSHKSQSPPSDDTMSQGSIPSIHIAPVAISQSAPVLLSTPSRGSLKPGSSQTPVKQSSTPEPAPVSSTPYRSGSLTRTNSLGSPDHTPSRPSSVKVQQVGASPCRNSVPKTRHGEDQQLTSPRILPSQPASSPAQSRGHKSSTASSSSKTPDRHSHHSSRLEVEDDPHITSMTQDQLWALSAWGKPSVSPDPELVSAAEATRKLREEQDQRIQELVSKKQRKSVAPSIKKTLPPGAISADKMLQCDDDDTSSSESESF
eukprot:m51a1_g11811 putative nod3 protein (666) ;mRNA; r:363753-366168